MGMMVDKGEEREDREKKRLPAGNHHAVCLGYFDLGSQQWGRFGLKPTVAIIFEVPSHRIDMAKEGEPPNLMPMVISEQYNKTLYNSNLKKILEQWRGRPFTEAELNGFDMDNIVGVNATLTIVHKPDKNDPNKLYANIFTVMPNMSGVTLEPENDTFNYEIKEGNPVPENMYAWAKKRIMVTNEYLTKVLGQEIPPDSNPQQQQQYYSGDPGPADTYDPDDDIPF